MEMKYVLRLNHNKCLLISYEVHTSIPFRFLAIFAFLAFFSLMRDVDITKFLVTM